MVTRFSDSYTNISDKGFSSEYIKSMDNLHINKLLPKLNYANSIDMPRLSKLNSSDLNNLINPLDFDYSFNKTDSKNKYFWESVRTSDDGFKSWLIGLVHKTLKTTEKETITSIVKFGLACLFFLITQLIF